MSKNARRGASRGPARKKKPQRQVPGWVWLFTGLMVGLFVAFLFHLGKTQMAQGGSTPVTNSSDKSAQSKPEPKPEPKPESGDDSPKFDFYAVLPKMEVIVPQNETGSGTRTSKPSTTEKPANTRKPESSTRNNEKYLLQAGSFRRNEDADRRRAELILKGFEASIQSVNLDSGDSWHRVMIGPYNNLNAMHRAQDQLAGNGIETLPIKMKK